MKKKIIEEAKQVWSTGDYFNASKIIYEHIPVNYRPFWAADLLGISCHMITDIDDLINDVIEIAYDKNRWKEAKDMFDKIRLLVLKEQEKNNNDTTLKEILYLAEKTCKIIYNSTQNYALFDTNVGWKIGMNILHIIDRTNNEEIKNKLLGTFFCAYY